MGPAPEDNRVSADEALARLIEGNRRFLRGEARGAAFRRETLADLARAQRPYATILGCSDSRVPPEWIFDAGLGELFVVRVAGNILSPEVAGTLQYAGSYLQTPLFVVLGHEGCGAIAAALAAKHEGEQFRSRIQTLLASILPGLPEFEPTLSPEEQVVAGRREQRAVDGPPDPGFAGRAGPGGGGADEDRRRGVRARDRPGPAPAPGRAGMTPWPVRQTFDLVVVGRRLGFDLVVVGRRLALLLAVAAYCAAVGLLVRTFEIRVISRGSATTLINTLILSLLLSFRNRAAYDRWWSARGLWGQLTNDTRNLAAKCAAFLPADVLARSRVAEMLVAFAEALKRHLRDEPPRLRDLPGFEHEEADPPHVPLYLAAAALRRRRGLEA